MEAFLWNNLPHDIQFNILINVKDQPYIILKNFMKEIPLSYKNTIIKNLQGEVFFRAIHTMLQKHKINNRLHVQEYMIKKLHPTVYYWLEYHKKTNEFICSKYDAYYSFVKTLAKGTFHQYGVNNLVYLEDCNKELLANTIAFALICYYKGKINWDMVYNINKQLFM